MRPTPILLKRPPSSIRRLQLTTKQAGKDYYKGTGSGAMGRHTKHGGYVLDYNKVRTYMVPAIPRNFAVCPISLMSTIHVVVLCPQGCSEQWC